MERQSSFQRRMLPGAADRAMGLHLHAGPERDRDETVSQPVVSRIEHPPGLGVSAAHLLPPEQGGSGVRPTDVEAEQTQC